MVRDRARTVRLRRHQVAYADRVIARHSPYVLPRYVVMCESGGRLHAVGPMTSSGRAGGLYQITTGTWAAYGGRGVPWAASRAEQDRVARRILAAEGLAPWACA